MKIHVVYNAFDEVDLVDRSLKTVYPYVDSVAIADVMHSDGKTVSTDGTHEKIVDFMKEHKDGKTRLYYRKPKELTGSYKRNQGIIKTELMDMCSPKDGDWIWIVEADEFYDEFGLSNLRTAVCGHPALQYDKRWLTVPMINFVYDLHHAFFAWSGRFFRYKQGADFELCNKFRWNGQLVYNDKYRWEIPSQYMVCYHLKYVKPIDRLRQRYMFPKNPAAQAKRDWFENVYMKYPEDPEAAYAYNRKKGNTGFDTGKVGRLFEYGGVYPKYLEDLA